MNYTILEKVYKMYLIASYLRCFGKQTNTWRHHRPFFYLYYIEQTDCMQEVIFLIGTTS